MCHGAAITKKINVLEPKRILDRWRRLAVRRRYNPIAAAGKTRPIRPLVRTFRAETAASPQQAKQDGSRASSVRTRKRSQGRSERQQPQNTKRERKRENE